MITTTDQMVEDTANRLFREQSEPAVVEAAEKGEWATALWHEIVEAGLTMALDDGFDGLPAALAIAKASGAYPVPVPVVETIIARGLAHAAGMGRRLDDKAPMSFAPPRLSAAKLTPHGGDAGLDGQVTAVPFGRWCRSLIVEADGPGGRHVAYVDSGSIGAIRWEQGTNLAGEPSDAGGLTIPMPAGTFAALPAGWDADALGALFRCFQMAGALRQALALTVRYANDRVQFGRPIGKFQALQHLIAEMVENTAAAETAAAMALNAHGTPRARLMLAAAKIRCGEAAGIVAAGAHQIHGAIGFTREHRLHHLTRRLYTWRDEFGNEGDWAVELGHVALAAGGDGVWPLLTGV